MITIRVNKRIPDYCRDSLVVKVRLMFLSRSELLEYIQPKDYRHFRWPMLYIQTINIKYDFDNVYAL